MHVWTNTKNCPGSVKVGGGYLVCAGRYDVLIAMQCFKIK